MKKSPKENSKEVVSDGDLCVLPQDKLEKKPKKLKASAAVRKISNETNRNIFDKSFHLYRVDPELVNYHSDLTLTSYID